MLMTGGLPMVMNSHVNYPKHETDHNDRPNLSDMKIEEPLIDIPLLAGLQCLFRLGRFTTDDTAMIFYSVCKKTVAII
jgi:hypothetical protein